MKIFIGCYVKKFFRIILLLEINLYVWSKMFNGIKKERDFIYKKDLVVNFVLNCF